MEDTRTELFHVINLYKNNVYIKSKIKRSRIIEYYM